MALRSRLRALRFDPVETILLVILGALAGYVAGTSVSTRVDQDPELGPYVERYGPARHSTGPEEWLIRDFFGDRRDGVFLDVGAGDPREGSNTYFLESRLGWSGLAVDALDFAAAYREHRPRTRFFQFFVSDRSGAEARLYVNPLNSELSSAERDMPASRGLAIGRDVPTITLDDLLDEAGITRLDFVSMDIELSEPAALQGFSLERYAPGLVCIEAHLQVRDQILEYFARHGYALVGRYLRADRFNLHFAPRAPETVS